MTAVARDQAEPLRRLRREVNGGKVVAVTSGKGGVGKSNIAVNLAIALSADGRHTVLFDADLGLANVDVLLGLVPKLTLADVVREGRDIQETAVRGPSDVTIIPGGSGATELLDLEPASLLRLAEAAARLDSLADFVIVDTGAGLSRQVTSFVETADRVLVVTTPEPTALTDAYAMIKAISCSSAGPRQDLRLVVNKVRDAAEARQVTSRIATVSARFLGVRVQPGGFVLADPCVGAAVMRQEAFVVAYPRSAASWCVRSMARGMIAESFGTPGHSGPARDAGGAGGGRGAGGAGGGHGADGAGGAGGAADAWSGGPRSSGLSAVFRRLAAAAGTRGGAVGLRLGGGL